MLLNFLICVKCLKKSISVFVSQSIVHFKLIVAICADYPAIWKACPESQRDVELMA